MPYQVFIERPADGSPGAGDALAARVAARFGVSEQTISARMQRGRFRVKAGVELDKARRFAAELERLGAVCSIADDAGRSVPIAEPAAPGGDFLTLEEPPGAAPEPMGLAAASAGGSQELGALAQGAGPAGLSLSALDGSGPDALGLAAPAGGAEAERTPAPDAFLPPEMQQESSIELLTPAPEIEAPPSVSPRAPSAEPGPAAPAPAPVAVGDDAGTAAPAPAPRPQPLQLLAERERLRLGVGAALAVLLGFLAAHLVASVRETGYADIRRDVIEAQAAVVSEDQWNALDGIRTATLERLEARKSSVVVSAMAVWLLVGGGVAFAWLRVIDWSRWQPAAPSSARPGSGGGA